MCLMRLQTGDILASNKYSEANDDKDKSQRASNNDGDERTVHGCYKRNRSTKCNKRTSVALAQWGPDIKVPMYLTWLTNKT